MSQISLVVPNFSVSFCMLFLVEIILPEWVVVRMGLMFAFAVKTLEGVWA